MLAPEAGRVRINVAMVIILMYAVFFFCHLHIDYHFFLQFSLYACLSV